MGKGRIIIFEDNYLDQKEEWKTHPEFDDYQVSNKGFVKFSKIENQEY